MTQKEENNLTTRRSSIGYGVTAYVERRLTVSKEGPNSILGSAPPSEVFSTELTVDEETGTDFSELRRINVLE
jgi:hypothetical protein